MDPIRVVVSRGSYPESAHLVDAVISGPDGSTEVWGDAERLVAPRSAVKTVQALPLLTTGAAERFDLSDEELALACASHSGEQSHLDAVAAWLQRIGLGPEHLECGATLPFGAAAAEAFTRAGAEPRPIHNCCSGKHTGFLTLARHLDVDPSGYSSADHPVQQLVAEALTELTGIDLSEAPVGIDGCGIPAYAIPLDRLALALARIGQRAVLMDALLGNAWWMSGTDRMETQIQAAATSPVVSKLGAEGVFTASLPQQELGIALKVRDGARRAANHTMGALLHRLGIVPEALPNADVTNAAGSVVGRFDVIS